MSTKAVIRVEPHFRICRTELVFSLELVIDEEKFSGLGGCTDIGFHLLALDFIYRPCRREGFETVNEEVSHLEMRAHVGLVIGKVEESLYFRLEPFFDILHVDGNVVGNFASNSWISEEPFNR